jgi:hypothetical protein
MKFGEKIWNLSDAYLQQEASSWGIFATGGLWVFMALCMVFMMLQDVICVIILI